MNVPQPELFSHCGSKSLKTQVVGVIASLTLWTENHMDKLSLSTLSAPHNPGKVHSQHPATRRESSPIPREIPSELPITQSTLRNPTTCLAMSGGLTLNMEETVLKRPPNKTHQTGDRTQGTKPASFQTASGLPTPYQLTSHWRKLEPNRIKLVGDRYCRAGLAGHGIHIAEHNPVRQHGSRDTGQQRSFHLFGLSGGRYGRCATTIVTGETLPQDYKHSSDN